jgi:hypothetical protein
VPPTPEPLEALIGDPSLPAQPLHLAQPPLEAVDHLMAHGPGLGAHAEQLVPIQGAEGAHRIVDPGLGAHKSGGTAPD